MQRTLMPPIRPLLLIPAEFLLKYKLRLSVSFTVLLQYRPRMPGLRSLPSQSRKPAEASFSGEANAPAEFLLIQEARSLSHSASVGTLKPAGQGLVIPDSPCHRLVFGGFRQ